MNTHKLIKHISILAILFVYPLASYAHIDINTTNSFSLGFLHPFSGIDHIIAMVGVGAIAAKNGGSSLWLMPGSFMLMMIAGSFLSTFEVPMSYIEIGITASVFMIGVMFSARLSMSTMLSVSLIGFFAVFHGFAHSAEINGDISSAFYGFGFLSATLVLHAIGIMLAYSMLKNRNRSVKYEYGI